MGDSLNCWTLTTKSLKAYVQYIFAILFLILTLGIR